MEAYAEVLLRQGHSNEDADDIIRAENALRRMGSYGENHWWELISEESENSTTEEAMQNKAIVVYYQLFREFGVPIIRHTQLMNFLFELTTGTGFTPLSCMTRDETIFNMYLKDILLGLLLQYAAVAELHEQFSASESTPNEHA